VDESRALGLDSASWAATWAGEEASQRRFVENLRAKIGDIPKTDPGLVDGRAVWADPALDESGWQPIDVPALWEAAGLRRSRRQSRGTASLSISRPTTRRAACASGSARSTTTTSRG
jgi:hypothetical protein